MLKRLGLRDFVIVTSLELELAPGFSVLTGETGAGKSILIDAVQLVLGSRGDAGVVREGAPRAEITAEFDTPKSLLPWLSEAGFEPGDTLLLRRVIDAQGKSRAWVNGSAATVAQLREAADYLVDIHGQHAWQSLTRSASVRQLLDAYAGVNTAQLSTTWAHWREATQAIEKAQTQQADAERERERLVWQIEEVNKLAPAAHEWDELNTEHQRLANAQALMDAANTALQALSEREASAHSLTHRALDAVQAVARFDPQLSNVTEVLQSASAQLQDAAHTLSAYLSHADLEPERLQALDDRLSLWIGLAKRYRRSPAELPQLLAQWQAELNQLNAATDLAGLQKTLNTAQTAFTQEAKKVSALRQTAAPKLSHAITQALQQLGMGGGVFEVALSLQEEPQSFGAESVEFLVSGHAGSTPRPLSKVASGGELSRIALAIAVTTSRLSQSNVSAGTLIFDEIDTGVGGTVADTVGRLMKQLGQNVQVMAVTHLPQVAACADHHFVVAKAAIKGQTQSDITPVQGPARVTELARMLGGAHLSSTSVAHAQEMLTVATDATAPRAPKNSSLSKKTP
jgi:DNA repair protein RecN (Recombination protein N)